MSLPETIVEAVTKVVGSRPVALHEPYFQGNEWLYVKECIDTTFVSSVGKFVDRFENDLASYTGAKYAVAVVNGTAALHISMIMAGVDHEDEVLVPALTFVGTANAVRYCDATPHFVDVEERTLGIDALRLRDYLTHTTEQRAGHCINLSTQRVIRALVPVHTFGHPCDIEAILALAHDFNLKVIEDAAESIGSTYNGKHTGTFGLLGAVSFNGNKTITTGGGGAILTNDAIIAKNAKHLTTTAKAPHRWAYLHDMVGYNYRLPNINAALGCAQLEQLPNIISAKRRLYNRYKDALAGVAGVRLFSEPRDCASNYWLQTLLLDYAFTEQLEPILAATNDVGIFARPVWALVNSLAPYRACPSMQLPVAKGLERRVINLPSSPSLELS